MTRRLTFAVAFAGGMVGAAVLPFAVMAGVEGVRLVQGGGGFANPATADLDMSTRFVSFGSSPADAGDVRFENATTMCWEASPDGTDVCMSVNTSEGVTFTGASAIDAVAIPFRTTGGYQLDANGNYGLSISGGTQTRLLAGGATTIQGSSSGLDTINIRQQDLTATCTTNQFKLDTGGAPELCFCQATDTWYCIAVTDTTGPAD